MRVADPTVLIMVLGLALGCDVPAGSSANQNAQAGPRKAAREKPEPIGERFGLSLGQRMRCFFERIRAEDKFDRAAEKVFDTDESLAEKIEAGQPAVQREHRQKAEILERYGLTQEQSTKILMEAIEYQWEIPEPSQIDAVIDSLPGPPLRVRTWTDDTGKHTIEAEFTGLIAGKVKLRKPSGEVIDVSLDRLSKADQEWIRQRAKKEGPRRVTFPPQGSTGRRSKRLRFRQPRSASRLPKPALRGIASGGADAILVSAAWEMAISYLGSTSLAAQVPAPPGRPFLCHPNPDQTGAY